MHRGFKSKPPAAFGRALVLVAGGKQLEIIFKVSKISLENIA